MAISRAKSSADPMGRGGRALGCQRCLGLTEHECSVVLRCHGCGFRCHPQCTYPPLRCNPRRLRHWMCEACAQERHAKSKVTMHYNYCVVCGSGGDLINKCATCRHASHADCESLHHGRCTLCARNMSVHTKRLDLYNWALIIARQKGRKVPVIQGKRIEWDSSGTKVLRQSIWATSEIVHALTEKLLVTRGGSIVRLRGRFDRAMAESACGAATDETKERPPRRVMELFEDGLPWDRWKCILSTASPVVDGKVRWLERSWNYHSQQQASRVCGYWSLDQLFCGELRTLEHVSHLTPPELRPQIFAARLQQHCHQATLARFHNDDHISKDLLSVTDLGVLVGEDILKLDASMEEEKSNGASAVGKNPRPKAKGKAPREHSAEPQEVEVKSLDDGWTKEEIERLYKAVDNEGHITDGFWKRVAKGVGTKTARECSRRYCRGGKKSPAPHRNKPVEAKTKLRSDDVDMGVDDRGTDIVFKKDGVRRFKAIQQFMKDHQFTDKEEDLLMDGLAAGDPGNLPLSDSDSDVSWDMDDIKIGGTPKAEPKRAPARRDSLDSVSSLNDKSEYDPFTYAQPFEQRVDPTSYTLCQTLHRQRQALLEGQRNRDLGLDIGHIKHPLPSQPIIAEEDEDGEEGLVEALGKIDHRNRLERQREKYINSDGELDEDFFSDDQEVI